jgi:sugar phosphate isomerase/epimerase
MKLALATHTPEVKVAPPVALLSGSFSERLEKAQRLGYDGVELMTAQPGELNPRELGLQLRACSLQVAAVASGPIFMVDGLTLLASSPETAGKASDRLEGLVILAEALEAPIVTIGSFRGRAAWVGGADAPKLLMEMLLEAAAHAARRGVRLALEPLNRYETDLIRNSAEGLQFLAEAAHPCLGLLLDTFHMNIEEPDIQAALLRVHSAGKLFHVHLGDSNRLPPGEGHFNFSGLVRMLQAQGYAGYLSAELFPLPDADTAAARTIEHMRQWLPSACQD